MFFLNYSIRTVENKDWATIIFIIALALITLSKTMFESRFRDFLKLLISDKYTKIYKDSSYLVTGFTTILFIVNLISLTFLFLLFLYYFNYGLKTDWILFVRIFTLLTVFILSKYLFEKIIAVTFGIEEIVEQFNLQKIHFRTYIGLILFPLTTFAYYTDILSKNLIITIITILIALNVVSYLISLKNYQKIIISKLFYFILYLCALEIAPYYFIYYLVTKK